MARSRLCRCCADFHDLAQEWPLACLAHFGAVQTGPGLHIISDAIAPFRSQADGKVYDSKSAYRRDLKSRGLIEVGNENVQARPANRPPPVRDDMRRAIQQLGG